MNKPMNRRESLMMVLGVPAMVLLPGMAAAQAVVGARAPAFEVANSANRKTSLADFAGKIVVLEWTSPSCPFVRAQYASGKMQEAQRWATSRGVVWLSVLSTNPARDDFLTARQAETFNRSRGASPMALLMDPSGHMGHAYGARTTPHMFVVAPSGSIAYAGAIDSRPTTDKNVVPQSRNLVLAALQDLLTGRDVAIAKTAPYGCLVGYEA